MKNIVAILGLLLLASCTGNSEQNNQGDTENELNSKFQEYFQSLDTIQKNYSVGCASGFYKILDERFVIRISPSLDFEYDNIKKLKVGTNSFEVSLELLEFEEGKASLFNICTDMHIGNVAKPINKYTNCIGTLVIGKSDPTDYYGNIMPRVSIYLDKVIFYDSLGNEKINIENELLWKVLDRGTPG
ncbi:MAG: hypothetical protein COA33_010240 [Fluviicola sp.]|nr:hypothetical protein [Fluviicola sp.]